MNTQNLPS